MKRVVVGAANRFMSDPFALLGLTKQYPLDSKDLEQAYFEAQKKTHPDQFAWATREEKAEAARKSTCVNQAYSLLRDPLKRAEYLLKEAEVELFTPDPLFLEQVMEWKEQQEAGKDIKQELLQTKQTLFEALAVAFKEKDYETAGRSLYQLQYLQRIELPLPLWERSARSDG